MKKLLKNNLWITCIVLGAVAGYRFCKNIVSINNTCDINSKPMNSIVYFIGGLVFSIFHPKENYPAMLSLLKKMD